MSILPSCREITEQASDYLDQDLSFWKRVGFRMHLLMCTYCRRHVKHLDLTVSALGKIEVEKADQATIDTHHIVERIKQLQREDNCAQ